MIKIKSKNGITLVSLIISIIILLILSTVTIYSVRLSNNTGPYNNMISDINLLEDKIFIYNNKYSEIPKTNRKIKIGEKEYYEIDLTKLNNITLNYGKEYGETGKLNQNTSDVYVVNESLEVYYLKGISLSNTIYYEN